MDEGPDFLWTGVFVALCIVVGLGMMALAASADGGALKGLALVLRGWR